MPSILASPRTLQTIDDDLRRLPSRELLDQFAVLAMLPADMAHDTAPLLAAIREELLRRLEAAS